MPVHWYLPDGCQVLTDELDKKERHSAKLINQTQDLLEKYTVSERLKEQALSQLEEARRRLREGKKEHEELKGNLGETKGQYEESERKKEEIKIRALDTVRQLVVLDCVFFLFFSFNYIFCYYSLFF